MIDIVLVVLAGAHLMVATASFVLEVRRRK
jgi:hypothetical protein